MSNRLPQLFADSFFPAFAADPFADENFFRTPTVFGRHADRVMKTDIRETDKSYELAIDLPGFKKNEVEAELRTATSRFPRRRPWNTKKRRRRAASFVPNVRRAPAHAASTWVRT